MYLKYNLNELKYKKYKFNLQNIENIDEKKKGVYALWHSIFCIYIGKAEFQPIKKRLFTHYTESHNKQLNLWLKALAGEIYFSYLEVPRSQISALESRAIRKFRPLTNMKP